MILEVNSESPQELIYSIAKTIDAPVIDGTMQIPGSYGTGYIKGIAIPDGPTILIRQYELKEELKVTSKASVQGNGDIIISYHNIYHDKDTSKNRKTSPAFVQMESAGIDYHELFPSRTRLNTIIIIIKIEQLKALINPRANQSVMQDVLAKKKPFIFEELISPEMQHVANQILTKIVSFDLQDFFFRIKAEELIFLLFAELDRRANIPISPLNSADVKTIYAIRDQVIEDLSINPNIPQLAKSYGISESKLKRLFRQIFGNSIYNYYQSLRMDRAGLLIRENKRSVAEIGYELGFSNLSHFASLFQRYNGHKPKKYAQLYHLK